MNKLFYSPSEELVFLVAGYTQDLNTDSVVEICASLTDNAVKLSQLVNCDISMVRTFEVTKSMRYKNMRVFYAKTNTAPNDCFDIGDTWTMGRWLQG